MIVVSGCGVNDYYCPQIRIEMASYTWVCQSANYIHEDTPAPRNHRVMASKECESNNDSTAEELDTFPCDSTATDPGVPDPLQFQGKLTITHSQEHRLVSTGTRLGGYEQWSMLDNMADESSKRGKLRRTKGSRTAIRIRDRAPPPVPR